MGEKQKVMLPNRKDNRGQQQPGRIKQAVANAHFHDGDSAETIWEPHRELTATFGVSREHSGRIERLGMIGVWETPTPDFRVILDQTYPWILCEHVRADHAKSVAKHHRRKKHYGQSKNYRYGSHMRSCLR